MSKTIILGLENATDGPILIVNERVRCNEINFELTLPLSTRDSEWLHDQLLTADGIYRSSSLDFPHEYGSRTEHVVGIDAVVERAEIARHKAKYDRRSKLYAKAGLVTFVPSGN